MEPTDTPSSTAALETSPASTPRPAGEVRREEASDPPTEERGEDWESPAYRRKATPADDTASTMSAASTRPGPAETTPPRARRGRPPATPRPEAVTSPATTPSSAPPMLTELVAMAELDAMLTRLSKDECTRALVWAVQKFNVDLHVGGATAKPASKAVATAVTASAPRAVKAPKVAKAPKAPKVAKAPKAPKAAKAPKAPKVAKVAPPKAAKAVPAKRGRPAGKAKVKAAAPTGKVVDVKALTQFIARHKPTTDVERLVVLAGFLAQQGQVLIETRDITGANKATGAKDFTNASATVAVSIKRSLFTRVGDKLRLTASGHALLTELSGAKRSK